MARNIVLLSDGTGQSGGAGYETNVWRLFRALWQDDDRQLVCYDDGVGSQRFKLSKALGGATGMGLATNVRELYMFLARHWQPGDRVYMFGFSRGAFTVRLLADMVADCGLLDMERLQSEKEFVRLTKAAYCACQLGYYQPAFPRRFKERFARPQDVPIHFLGVWDTVAAIGLPLAEIRFAVHNLMQYGHRGTLLNAQVQRACQALSIDDCRQTFHPLIWDERLEESSPKRIEQVWFAGVHSNIGGGYPKNQMARVTLDWMIEQVKEWDARCPVAPDEGLLLHAGEVDRIRQEANVHGQLYDSRLGLAAAFRYLPRDLEEQRRNSTVRGLKVHDSVFARIRQVTDLYSPHNLPPRADNTMLRREMGKSVIGVPWRQAMAAAKEAVLLQRVAYYAMLGTALLALVLAIPVPGLILPLAALFVVLVVALARLRRLQNTIASAGWATVFPTGRVADPQLLAIGTSNRLLRLAKRLRTSGLTDAWSLMTAGMTFLGVFLCSPLIWLGRQLHQCWKFRDIDHASLARPYPLEPGRTASITLETNMYGKRTGLLLKKGKSYEILVDNACGWFDKRYSATPAGLRRSRTLPSFMRRARRWSCLPEAPFFCLLAAIGTDRPQQIGLGTTLRAGQTGELRLYVNDALPRLPVFREFFYWNNRGVARIHVREVVAADTAAAHP